MRTRRLAWLGLGLLATGLGLVGIFLPLLPTTPFLLLAAFAFSRSSPRLHARLVEHPRLGPPLRDWQDHGAIGGRAKLAAMLAIAATFALSVWAGIGALVLGIQALVLTAVSAFILTRPRPPRGRVAQRRR